ncbi:hypothetical protein C8Q74DRAFT_562300 [Fomes fomentarius]|nr:hypothetical protein C8Q74DRAFT_562300 [Fomes fomentarius]
MNTMGHADHHDSTPLRATSARSARLTAFRFIPVLHKPRVRERASASALLRPRGSEGCFAPRDAFPRGTRRQSYPRFSRDAAARNAGLRQYWHRYLHLFLLNSLESVYDFQITYRRSPLFSFVQAISQQAEPPKFHHDSLHDCAHLSRHEHANWWLKCSYDSYPPSPPFMDPIPPYWSSAISWLKWVATMRLLATLRWPRCSRANSCLTVSRVIMASRASLTFAVMHEDIDSSRGLQRWIEATRLLKSV